MSNLAAPYFRSLNSKEDCGVCCLRKGNETKNVGKRCMLISYV